MSEPELVAAAARTGMDKLPLEIVQRVLYHSCSDDGSTGRALSLVSRQIMELSRSCKLRSIAVHGVRQMYAFAAIVLTSPARLRSVEHLFICDTVASALDRRGAGMQGPALFISPDEFHEMEVLGHGTDVGDIHESLRRPRRHDPSFFAESGFSLEEQSEAIRSTYERILQVLAPTLITLSASLTCSGVRPYILVPCSLPSLVELSVGGPFHCSADAGDREASAQLTPSLRRLSLTIPFGPNVFPPVQETRLLPHISRHAPHLRHLWLGGYFSHSLREDIRDVFSCKKRRSDDLPEPDASSVAPQRPFLRKLRQLYIRTDGDVSYNSQLDPLCGLPRKHKEIILIPPPLFPGHEFTTVEVYRQWRNRLDGGKGFWQRPPSKKPLIRRTRAIQQGSSSVESSPN